MRSWLRDKGLNRVGLEILPKINRGNPGKEASIDAKCVRVIEGSKSMQSNSGRSTTADMAIQIVMMDYLLSHVYN